MKKKIIPMEKMRMERAIERSSLSAVLLAFMLENKNKNTFAIVDLIFYSQSSILMVLNPVLPFYTH
jgi:hypothetical protein